MFLGLRAPTIRAFSDVISDEAINEYVRRWVRGEAEFQKVLIRSWTYRDWNTMTEGIVMVPWDEQFERDK
uniref:FBA_2 domain-containing protein n=1 Tax=Caenorhabditis tropicalis TaxID=1561998 RepID=A0A1I7UUW8_9PELO